MLQRRIAKVLVLLVLSSVDTTQSATAELEIVRWIESAAGVLEKDACWRDVNRTLEAVRFREPWALAMLDASVKFPEAVALGSRFQFGSYDECLRPLSGQSLANAPAVPPQYCLVHVSLEGFPRRDPIGRDDTSNGSSRMLWGVCLPAVCSEGEVTQLLTAISGYDADFASCQRWSDVSAPAGYDLLQTATACILLLFALMISCSTLYGLCGEQRHKPVVTILRAFSITENLRKLVQVSKDDHGLGCLNGIKAIAMVFILGGHALLFMAGGPLLNAGFFREQSRLLHNAFLLNSPLLVDTFLLLSGFLFARLLLLELDKRQGRVNFALLYLFRYVRLTPAYLAVIALYATWLPLSGDGPLWGARMAREQHRCRENWWANVLYVNNYVGTEEVCMFQSWYLAADTQLFVLAPVLLYPMWRFGRRVALLLIGSITTISILVPFGVTYAQRLDPTFMVFADEVSDLQANDYFVNVYGKTHLRATAYLFGLLVGYLVHWMQIENVRINRRMLAICWIVSGVCGTTAMFSLTAFYTDLGTQNYLYNALYAALHRFGWSLSNGWLVLVCVTGHSRTLKRFLSARAFVPLSRLTYCAYLTNGLVELYLAASRRTPLYASIATLTAETISHILLTFLLALVLCLMFESPIHGLEKMLLHRFRPSQSPTRAPETSSLSTSNNTHSTSEEA
ncbi:nose resistant to fluoxetine protein 6-like [Anopheles nili]|uniref:nose resistant to fluoxetine protein 6-like n=1 Tax=Anopheles nili TaxID=185578 RepID=UPI00237A5A1D|nr:nose resistant to fluoxetine protein 6-like [Anopheles nili]